MDPLLPTVLLCLTLTGTAADVVANCAADAQQTCERDSDGTSLLQGPHATTVASYGEALLQKSFSKTSARAKVGLVYVHDPQPVSAEHMQTINTQQMIKNSIGEDVIFTYPPAQDEHVSADVQLHGNWEGNKVASICAPYDKVKGRADFLDVGANIGTYSIPMARCLEKKGLGGKVVAVEGMPNIAEHLEASVAKNGLQKMVQIYDYALSDTNMAKDKLEMQLNPTNKGGSNVAGLGGTTSGDKIVTKVTTLDSILGSSSHAIFAMKIDVEGSEGRALLGAKKFLADSPPCLLQIELNSPWLSKAGTPRDSVVATLETAGYDVSNIKDVPEQTTLIRQKDFEKCVARFA
eukprot:gnl/TRDRNA2_/TRDRNA2_181931_c0_seq1.p1 gnl/TRDRNA2_/TRDRNA2_181931_c0~~gnl/TRDRNA2_/TRDRNA2_181931_c0_seq1.p1  ORF type:complete len:349 (-),score=69.78 gnl/TRDRNA2_/TRDRNA2_181931_c0_seq1:116-1162(-)